MTKTVALMEAHRDEIVEAMESHASALFAAASVETDADFADTLTTVAIQFRRDAKVVMNAPTTGSNGSFIVVDEFVRDMAETALVEQQERAEQAKREAAAAINRTADLLSFLR